jgi:predicted nucleic acid-binding Zn finger protein
MTASRETTRDKADRLLLAGRLTVTLVSGEHVEARVQGDSGWHRCGYSRGRGWWCSCPLRELGGRGKACSHLLALQKVAARTARQQRPA